MKYCNKCSTSKDVSEFNKRGDKYQSECRLCISKRHKDRRKVEGFELNKRQRDHDAIRKASIEQKVVNHLKANPCPCGETNIVRLDFDHLGDKVDNIATMVWKIYSWERIEAEIKKCQVLCANCHRDKTAKQLNSWKLKYI